MNDTDIQRFAWLADAPLFIDALQIERFYDAVLRPSYVEGANSVTLTESTEGTLTTKVSAEGKIGFGGGLLKHLFGVTAEVKAGGEVGTGDKHGSSEGRQTQWIPIRTPQRQLEQLIFAYLDFPQTKDRVLELSQGTLREMFKPDVVTKLPRAIVVLDLPGKTRFVPTAAELEKGGVVLLYQRLKAAQVKKVADDYAKDGSAYLTKKLEMLQAAGSAAPLPVNPSPLAQREQESWEKFLVDYDSWLAMKIVEDAAVDHRIRWIDFRVPLTVDGASQSFHLHICPAGAYDTGVFAYNFIQRGYEHGVRIVGTLKAGSDVNVLAIYEK